jgi:hemerythrin superfamily protein
MEATRLLTQDHRTVDQLFSRFEKLPAGASGEKLEIVREIVKELSIHAAIEEQVLYPVIRDEVPGGQALHQEALQEHQEAKEVLSELDGMSPQDPGYDARVTSLIQDVRHHVEEEEGQLFPKLREGVSAERLHEMGEAMEQAKKTVPTRPHPMAPSSPPGNLVAGPVAGVVDRARDAARKPARKAKPTTGRRKPATRKKAATARGRRGGRAVYHVTPDPQGGWRAEKEGAARALARGTNKSDVVGRAREAARTQKGQLLIHGRDGRIQEERSYGDDPRRTRG